MTSPLVHFDIAGPDDAALRTFYERTLGWAVHDKGPGYALVEPGSGPRGAIVDAEAASVTIGIGVENLDATLAAVIACGGAVVMPATNNGWVTKAQITDPAGNLITIIQS
jgi:predicted enzyme related to lactoylglutathione lyase